MLEPQRVLIRLKVDLRDSKTLTFIPNQKFGGIFARDVGNPKDMLHFIKKKAGKRNNGAKSDQTGEMQVEVDEEEEEDNRVSLD